MGTEREITGTQSHPAGSIDGDLQDRRAVRYANWSVVVGAVSLLPSGFLVILVLAGSADLPLYRFVAQIIPGILFLLVPISWVLGLVAVLLGATGGDRSNTYNRALALIGIWLGVAAIFTSTATMLVFL